MKIIENLQKNFGFPRNLDLSYPNEPFFLSSSEYHEPGEKKEEKDWVSENDSNYSFRAYMTDISLWVMLTDLAPHQQCAAIIMRLGGQARELARMISPQEIVPGGWRDGILLDPVTCV